MDTLFQKAKEFAQETAKKSQEIALEAAKFSQEIAVETAKRSKEIAAEASRKADELKKLAGELPPSIASAASKMAGDLSSSSAATPTSPPTDAELEELGITSSLREYVRGLTINTFKEFPLEEYEAKQQDEGMDEMETPTQDLPEWKERHALTVLKTVPEMSDFRYALCPRRMKDQRFWRIYFILVKNYVESHEARYLERAKSAEEKGICEGDGGEEAAAGGSVSESLKAKEASNPVKERSEDQELDAYLLGADSGDDGPDPDDDGDFDDVFDKALDSEGEDDTPKQDSTATHKLSTASKASEGSSDGELVEAP